MFRRILAAGGSAAASMLIAGSALAQVGALSGAVYEPASKTGLAGAEVQIVGTKLVAMTAADGSYTITDVPAGMRKVRITRPGYLTFSLSEVRIEALDTAHVYVALAPEPAAHPHHVSTAEPGVVREPGPMYIIDGVILASGVVPPKIDPKTIESVEVIGGDAARKMYGESAVTGVIMITTRKMPDGR